MIARLALKSSLLGSVGSGAYISTIIDIPDSTIKSVSPKITADQKKKFSTGNWKTMTLYDVEMFENARGCKFAFTDDFKSNKSYTVREWFDRKTKEDPKKDWREEFGVAVQFYKHHCKPKTVLVIEPQGALRYLKPKLIY